MANMFAELVQTNEAERQMDDLNGPESNPGFTGSIINFNPMMDGEEEHKMNIDDTLPDFGDDIIGGSGEPDMLDSNANQG